MLSPPHSLHPLHSSDCSDLIRRRTGSGRVVSCARRRMRLDKPAKLSPWNALTDMECLLTYNKADVFSVIETIHENEIVYRRRLRGGYFAC